MVKLYTSYFGAYKTISPEVQCISIANSKPQGLFIPQWTAVVPNWNLVKAYKEGRYNYRGFSILYERQLNSLPKADVQDFLIGQINDIALMCWEKDSTKCHRSVLFNWLKTNVKVEGLEYAGEYRE